MNEKPLEWMTEYGESVGHRVGRILALVMVALAFLFFLMTGMLLAIIAGVVFLILFVLLQLRAFTEYEFCYFADEVDVAAIYNRSRRKKRMTIKIADVEYMVKKLEPKETTKYFCNKKNLGSLYTLSVNQDGKRMAIVMEADPVFVKAMEMRRKVR